MSSHNEPEEDGYVGIYHLVYRDLIWSYICYKDLKNKELTKPLDNYFLYRKNPKLFLRKHKLNDISVKDSHTDIT